MAKPPKCHPDSRRGCWAEGSCVLMGHMPEITQPRAPRCNAVPRALYISLSLTPPSECVLLLHPRAISKLRSQLFQLFLISTILFPFFQQLFKKNLLSKNCVPRTVLGTNWTKQTWHLIDLSLGTTRGQRYLSKQVYLGAPFRSGLCQRFGLLVLLEVGLGNEFFYSWRLSEEMELVSDRLWIRGECEA